MTTRPVQLTLAARIGGGGPVDGPGSGGSGCPCDECDGRCAPPDDSDYLDDGPAEGPGASGPGDDEPGDDEPDDELGDDEPGDDDPDERGPGGGPRGGSEPPSARRPEDDAQPSAGGDAGPGTGADGGSAPPAPRSPLPQHDGGPPPTLTNLVFPLATFLGLAERPGEGHGLGTLDPALCRALAATAVRSPHTTVCVTVTDHDGIAIGHGCAKPGRLARPPDGPPPPLVALPARINLTITATRLMRLRADTELGPSGSLHDAPPGGPQTTGPPGLPGAGWALAPQRPFRGQEPSGRPRLVPRLGADPTLGPGIQRGPRAGADLRL